MRLVFSRKVEVAEFIVARTEVPLSYENVVFEAVGVEDGQGRLVAGVTYQLFRPLGGFRDLEANIAIDKGWHVRRDLLRQGFIFAFWTLKAIRVTATIPDTHAKSRKMLKTLGFRHEGNHRHGLGYKRTSQSYGMTFDRCPWLTDADKAKIGSRIRQYMNTKNNLMQQGD